MSNGLEVGFAQLNPTVGAISNNTDSIIEVVEEKSDEVDLIVFPELSIIGYPPMDLLHHGEIIKAQIEALERIRGLTEKNDYPSVIVGCALEENGVLQNMAVVVSDGQVECKYAKRLLPTYDIFDEHRYFEPGDSLCTVDLEGYTVGLSVCEDSWSDVEVAGRPQHQSNPMEDFASVDVDLVVNLSASPFSVGKTRTRFERFQNHAEVADAPVLFVNQVGANDEIVFDGRSFVVTEDGVMDVLDAFSEDYGSVVLPDATNRYITVGDVDRTEEIRYSVELGISDYFDKTGFSEAIVGMSGGIDSSVTVALASSALGTENVYGVMLPSSVTSEQSVDDARAVAENLGIEFDVIDVSDVIGDADSVLNEEEEGYGGIARENVQARVRGVVLMAIANTRNALVLTPDNKSEAGVGYCTLYGDTVGAIAPLGDVYKRDVYGVAEHLNRDSNLPSDGRRVIPASVIEKPPSAELSEGQSDEDDIPPYDVIDNILERHVEDTEEIDGLVEDHPREMVSTVLSKLRYSEFKKEQTPPPIRITDKAFGKGWKYPVAADYDSLNLD